ncbi:transglycosylase SLT domain-containing protein [Candidatus Methylocalor cossyra]|uniref:Soluble lytic murein transglycosylase n=1 Tax=Candidatus Methylocalor cossyra TaxID=3108543 RepID=A0ABM9NJF6_9GAMM
MKPLRCLLGGLLLAGTASAQDFIHQARALRLEAARYEHAQGVPRDYGRAYALYCKAALLGDALAAYSLGWMYFNGRGLSRQAELAVGWFKRAAKAGDVYAARMLLRYGNITGSEDPRCQPEPPPTTLAQYRGRTNPNRQFLEDRVAAIARDYFVDPQLVLAVIEAESGFNPAALSSKNAQGLMQLIPATAERFGVRNVWDPLENIKGGTAYLHWLLRHFSGNVAWTVAAYNAGERTVEQFQGVPPYPETQNYVKRILAVYPRTVHPVPPPLADNS